MHGGVLTLGCFRSTLIAARSLARAGYTVTAGVDRRSFLAYSRYIRHTWRHGHIHLNGALGRILVEYLAGHPEIQYIFPTGDSSTMLVANHYDQVRQFAVPVMPPPQVAMNCVNKSHAYTVAAVANVLTPPMRRTEGLGELYGAAEEIGYPCIIKPNDSMGDFFGLKAIICRSPSELHRRVPVWPWGDRPLLVQRFITGYRINCDVVAVNGRIMSFFQSRVRRTHRHDNTGLTVDAISVPPDPVVRDRCERIVAAFAYTGVALIQFLRDGEDAEPVFLEINPRLGAYVTFPYHLGYDYPLLAMYCADVLAGRQVAEPRWPQAYPGGRQLHWLMGDVNGLMEPEARVQLTFRDRCGWLWQIVRSACRRNVSMSWSLRDPLPTLWLGADFLLKPIRRRWRRLFRRPRWLLGRMRRLSSNAPYATGEPAVRVDGSGN